MQLLSVHFPMPIMLVLQFQRPLIEGLNILGAGHVYSLLIIPGPKVNFELPHHSKLLYAF